MFGFEPKTQFIFCCGPKAIYERDDDVWDRYYIMARMICLARPGRDLIIAPGTSGASEADLPMLMALREFIEFICVENGLSEAQIIWTSGRNYVLDLDIVQDPWVLEQVHQQIKPRPQDWCMVPYAITPEFEQVLADPRLEGVQVFGDREDDVHRAGKLILHPHIRGPEYQWWSSLPEGIRVAPGYSCTEPSDVPLAVAKMREEGHGTVMVKAGGGAAGEGIYKIGPNDSMEHIPWMEEGMIVEKCLDLDTHSDGSPQAGSRHWCGRSSLGPVAVQFVEGTSWDAGVIPANPECVATGEIAQQGEVLCSWRGLKGPWGGDWLISGGRAFFGDPNWRLTMMHVPQEYGDAHCPGKHLIVFRFKPTCTVAQMRERIGDQFFVPGQTPTGYFPQCWVYAPELDDGYGIMIAVANNRSHALRMRMEFASLLD